TQRRSATSCVEATRPRSSNASGASATRASPICRCASCRSVPTARLGSNRGAGPKRSFHRCVPNCEDPMTDEGVLDPVAKEWIEANPMSSIPLSDIIGSPEILPLARGESGAEPTRAIAKVTDDVVEGVPVRFYEHAEAPTGLVVYFHGGAYCIGSI